MENNVCENSVPEELVANNSNSMSNTNNLEQSEVALVQDVDFTDEDAAVEVDESGLELETELEEDTELASSIEL
ncbi:MAG: hypothetical protein R3Y04_08245, partial [Rikenellaceae bacterium]